MLDLEPVANRVADLVRHLSDDDLTRPTPCTDMNVAGLLDHFLGLTREFRDAAAKVNGNGTPSASAEQLDPEWRTLLPHRLDALAAAWKDPAAWEGTATAGGVTMPADVMGSVALNELVLHGWDLARSTGQDFECDDASVRASFEFTEAMSVPGEEAGREGLFGPVVVVPENAPTFERALGYSGRDPHWAP